MSTKQYHMQLQNPPSSTYSNLNDWTRLWHLPSIIHMGSASLSLKSTVALLLAWMGGVLRTHTYSVSHQAALVTLVPSAFWDFCVFLTHPEPWLKKDYNNKPFPFIHSASLLKKWYISAYEIMRSRVQYKKYPHILKICHLRSFNWNMIFIFYIHPFIYHLWMYFIQFKGKDFLDDFSGILFSNSEAVRCFLC